MLFANKDILYSCQKSCKADFISLKDMRDLAVLCFEKLLDFLKTRSNRIVYCARIKFCEDFQTANASRQKAVVISSDPQPCKRFGPP